MADFPLIFELADLDGSNGVRLNGDAFGGLAGAAVAAAGDVNGDGFDDIIVGAPFTPGGAPYAGSSYVVFGRSGGLTPNANLGSVGNGFRLLGVARDDYSGSSVASAGDINGDGFDDLIVGAPYADARGSNSGAAYVVFGKAAAFATTFDLSSLTGGNGFKLGGAGSGDQAGASVASAGDINGDGFDDLIVGAPYANPHGNDSGAAYVVFGKNSGFADSLDLSSLNGANGFRLNGVTAGDNAGNSVASAGDVNGDGFDDVIIGAYYADGGGTDSGSAYVVFGKAGSFGAAIDLSGLNGSNGFALNGVGPGDAAGTSVASAGDVNGDGFDDLIIGAPDGDGRVSGSGASYVVFGKAGGFSAAIDLAALNGATGFRIAGFSGLDYSGISVASAGDINGDGFDDLIAGAMAGDFDLPDCGTSYVIFGKGGGFAPDIGLDDLDGSNGFLVVGQAASGWAGFAVSSAGDVNSDGFDDLLIGAPGENALTGGAYVVYGHATGAVNRIGTPGNDVFDGSEFADILDGADGNDRLDGRGGDDILRGGNGKDLLEGGDGDDLLDGGTGNDVMRGGRGNDIYVIDNPGDIASEVRGDGIDLIRTTIAVTLSFDIENLEIATKAAVDGIGNAADNVMTGGIGANHLFGLNGNDTLIGNRGNDILDGGSGSDVMRGGSGNDVYIVNSKWDVVDETGSSGSSDRVETTRGAYVLGDRIENLTLLGTRDSTGTGNAAKNVLIGNSGDNVLTGLGGKDTLTGGDGSDTFVFGAGFGKDRITDFTADGSPVDVIRFTDNLFADFADVLAHARQDDSDVVIKLDKYHVLFLNDLLLTDLQENDFLFA